MKKISAILTVLAILFPMWGAGPRLVIPDNDVWVGALPADTVAELSVTIRNEGDADLLILRVNRACNCVEAEFPQEPIPPGDSASVTLRLYAARIAQGDFVKYVTLVSNDPDYTKRFYFSGEIMPPAQK